MKGLQDHNLRDHMSEAELIFTALAELSTRQIAETDEATGMAENKLAATQGGAIAKQGRKARENKTRRPVVSSENFLPPPKGSRLTTVKKAIRKARAGPRRLAGSWAEGCTVWCASRALPNSGRALVR